MYNSIQHFVENGIPQLEENQKKFMENPSSFEECVVRVKHLYVEVDEDHIALQFHNKKGDIKRWKGHGDNGRIIKLVYVNERYEEKNAKRKKLKNVVYFGGLYSGKEENEKLWGEVKEYIENTYDTEYLETVYFQSDGGSWMKKGIEMLGGTFVLDGFYLKKYGRHETIY